MKRLLFFAVLLTGNLFAQISAPKNLRIDTGEPSPTPTPADPQDIDLTGYKLVFEENFDVLSVAETDAKGDKHGIFPALWSGRSVLELTFYCGGDANHRWRAR